MKVKLARGWGATASKYDCISAKHESILAGLKGLGASSIDTKLRLSQ